MRQMHIIEITLRLAIAAEDKDKAMEVAKEEFIAASDDGSLSDLMVYEWDDPVYVRAEEPATE